MKPKHDAKTRLEHYKEAYRLIATPEEFPEYVCVALCEINNGHDVDIKKDYPEFYEQKPNNIDIDGSWFFCFNDRLKAIDSAIELVTAKIEANELD